MRTNFSNMKVEKRMKSGQNASLYRGERGCVSLMVFYGSRSLEGGGHIATNVN